MINYPDSIRVYDDFLPVQTAQALYANVSGIPQQWFSLRKTTAKYIDQDPIFSKTWWSIHGDKSHPSQLHMENKMTYQYMATDNHQAGCDCTYCEFQKILTSNMPPEVSDQIISECHLTVYRPGDYLSQHHDSTGRRTWAFTYTLSTGWKPEWGGILNIQDPDNGNWHAFPPMFNRLILIDVSNKNCNHFVSHVIPDCPVNRVTFSGWFEPPRSLSAAA